MVMFNNCEIYHLSGMDDGSERTEAEVRGCGMSEPDMPDVWPIGTGQCGGQRHLPDQERKREEVPLPRLRQDVLGAFQHRILRPPHRRQNDAAGLEDDFEGHEPAGHSRGLGGTPGHGPGLAPPGGGAQ